MGSWFRKITDLIISASNLLLAVGKNNLKMSLGVLCLQYIFIRDRHNSKQFSQTPKNKISDFLTGEK